MFTALTSFDEQSAKAILAEARPDEMRHAVLTLAGLLMGCVMGNALVCGQDPTYVLRFVAQQFGANAPTQGGAS